MNIYLTIAGTLWVILWAVWFVGQLTQKRKAEQKWDAPQTSSLVFIIVGFVFSFTHSNNPTTGPVAGVIGVAVCACGIILAFWARYVLGRNWSGTIAVKHDHELVTSGPYHYVRHPIYTGLLAGFIGLAIVAESIYPWIGVLSILIAFLIRIPAEEKIMTQLFPEQYAAYRRRTKALIPFIF